MNSITREIAELFGLSIEIAAEVHTVEEVYVGIDYSEATQEELVMAHTEAYQIWQESRGR